MKILYAEDNFKIFNQCRAFLIEMPYKHYIKDLQAEIDNDRNLFPHQNYLKKLMDDENVTKYIKIIDDHVYFWACEDLSMFKLFINDDINILKNIKSKPLNKKVFSLLYLMYISIEMTIFNYTNYNNESELKQKKELYGKIIDSEADNKQWIADYYFMKYMNEMELIDSNDFSFKNLFKNYKKIMIEYFTNGENKDIIINSNIELIILIRITKNNKFRDIGYVLCKYIEDKYFEKYINAKTLYVLIEKYGYLYKNKDFQNLDEKYLEQFNMK